jgi:putative ABC transport system substrate-binding protein
VNRRRFVVLVGGLALANGCGLLPRTTGTPTFARIGVLGSSGPAGGYPWPDFVDELQKLGWKEGQNLAFVWTGNSLLPNDLADATAHLIQVPVDVILTFATQAVRAAQQATQMIPIVMTQIGDPVGAGLVTSLAHPGGNVTGTTTYTTQLAAKRVELLAQVVPAAQAACTAQQPQRPEQCEPQR